jgi:hypothetical protein
MGYGITTYKNEYPLGMKPPEYTWLTKDLASSTGWSVDKIRNLCTRSNFAMPCVAERRGMQATRYFNPREVAAWMKAEAERKGVQYPEHP